MEEAENIPKRDEKSPSALPSKPPEMDWLRIKREREEYFEKLRRWLDDARLWYSLAGIGFPDGTANNQPQSARNNYQQFYQPPPFGQNDGLRFRNNRLAPNRNAGNEVPLYQTYPFILPPNLLRLPTTYEFKIPSLWRRLGAELIDFCFMFILKLGLTFFFLESFSLGNALDLYSLEVLQKGILEGQEVNFPLAMEVVLLEFLHRFIVCAFETYFLHGKTCATPGKRCMGLMVVQVETLVLVPNRPTETVSATGVKAPGWHRALLRTLLKSLIVGLLLPLCVTFYLFPFNRTSYDMMANTLVVEAHPEFLLYQSLIVR